MTDGDWILKENYVDQGVRLIQVGDVGKGEFIGKSNRFISHERAIELGCTFLDFGDVLISRMPDPLGRACIFPSLHEPAITAVDVTILKPDLSLVVPQYLKYYLNSDAWLLEVLRYATGTTRPRISRRALEELTVPTPPLAEQERIVKLLDEADALRKLRAQANQRTAQLIPALFHEMFGDPVTNPKGWPVMPFGQLASNKDGRRKPVKASDRSERRGDIPYYGASGIIDYVDEYIFDEPALLIAEDGANLVARSTPIAFLALGKYWVNNHAHVVTENGLADMHYLCSALNLRGLDDYITGSAQPKLAQSNLNRIPIAVPPLQRQREFTKRVTEIRELESRQAANRCCLDDVFQVMLHRAFAGEL